MQYAKSEIAKLNKKYAHLPVGVESTEKNEDLNIDRFYFLHRKRIWNSSEGKWMGWERKRGKLHEFNRLLRGDKSHSFISLTDSLKQNPLLLNQT